MAPLLPQPKILSNEEIEALSRQLRDESTSVRLSALETAVKSAVPSDAFSLADSLVEVLQSNAGPEVKSPAAVILVRSFVSTPKYARSLLAAMGDVIETVAPFLFFRLPKDQIYVPEYLAVLRHNSANVRSRFMLHLHYGPFDTAITQEIISALSDQDVGTRAQAAGVLASIFVRSKEQAAIAKPALIAALKDPERAIAFTAAKALRSLEETIAEADQVFDDAMQANLFSEDENIRKEALQDLGSASKGDAKYLPRLIELLGGTHHDQYYSILVLQRLGAHAQPAIPHLKQMLFGNRHVADVAKALAAIDTENQEVVDWLAGRLMQTNPHIRGAEMTYAIALTYFGKQGLPYLIKGLEWHNSFVRSYCVEQLGNVGKDAAAAIPHLLQLLEDGDGQPLIPACGVEGRSALIESLVKIGAEDERVVSRLRAIAQDAGDCRSGVAEKALKFD